MSYSKAIAEWKRKMGNGHILVDLDGTLAHYDKWGGPYHIGAPIPRMVERIKKWREQGIEVLIFTARATDNDPAVIYAIKQWCIRHLGFELEVTNTKTYMAIEIWDDRAVQVIPNTGERVDGLDETCCYNGSCNNCTEDK